MVAEALFFRPAPGAPLRYMYYLPGDFAVFDGRTIGCFERVGEGLIGRAGGI
jgi:hypothetical protein